MQFVKKKKNPQKKKKKKKKPNYSNAIIYTKISIYSKCVHESLSISIIPYRHSLRTPPAVEQPLALVLMLRCGANTLSR